MLYIYVISVVKLTNTPIVQLMITTQHTSTNLPMNNSKSVRSAGFCVHFSETTTRPVSTTNRK